MASRPITVYVCRGSRACDELLKDLARLDRPVRVLDVVANPELVPELLKLTGGRRIVPVMVDAGRVSIAPEGGDAF